MVITLPDLGLFQFICRWELKAKWDSAVTNVLFWLLSKKYYGKPKQCLVRLKVPKRFRAPGLRPEKSGASGLRAIMNRAPDNLIEGSELHCNFSAYSSPELFINNTLNIWHSQCRIVIVYRCGFRFLFGLFFLFSLVYIRFVRVAIFSLMVYVSFFSFS